MEELERDFKGVWIPKEIWLDDRLSALDKIILTEITSLDKGEEGCWASNKYLAEFCQCAESKISLTISKLKELDYIEQIDFDGRKRYIKTKRQTFKNYKADFKNLKETNIDNNIDNFSYVINNKEEEIEEDNTEKYIEELNKLGIKEKKLQERMSILREFIKDKQLSPDEEYNLRNYILQK